MNTAWRMSHWGRRLSLWHGDNLRASLDVWTPMEDQWGNTSTTVLRLRVGVREIEINYWGK